MSFWARLRNGPWPDPVLTRLESALRELTDAVIRIDVVAALVLFGSFARGEYGRKSDVDLLVLLDQDDAAESSPVSQQILRLIGELESQWRLPMRLAPMISSARRPDDLGADLMHDLWHDGVVLYGQAHALAALQPDTLVPWTLFRFSASKAAPSERVHLSRRLHGSRERPGLVRPPALVLGRGALLVPADQHRPVLEALEVAGATYDIIPVWRPSSSV